MPKKILALAFSLALSACLFHDDDDDHPIAPPASAHRTEAIVTADGSADLIGAIGDTLTLALAYHNPAYANDSVEWVELWSGKSLRKVRIQGRDGTDTLRLELPDSAGLYQIGTRIRDSLGREWPNVWDIQVEENPLTAAAGVDTSVSISDTVRLHGKATRAFGAVAGYAWDIGNTGTFTKTSSPDTVILAPAEPGRYLNIFRAYDGKGHVAQDTLRLSAYDDIPNVQIASTLRNHAQGSGYRLNATVEDKGKILKWEWSTDGGATYLARSGGDTAFFPKDPVDGTLLCKLRVTDDDGHIAFGQIELAVSRWSVEQPGNESQIRPPITALGNRLFGTDKNYWRYRGVTYDPITGASDDSSHSNAVIGDNAVAIGHKIYSLFRSNFGGEPEGLYEYDTDFQTRVRRPNLNWFGFSLTAQSGMIYVIGAKIGSPPLDPSAAYDSRSFARFNPGTNDWEMLPDLPIDIYWPTLAAVGGKIYAFGGAFQSTDLPVQHSYNRRLFVYDVATGIWSEKAPHPLPLFTFNPPNKAWCVALNGKLYAGLHRDLLEYDPALDQWKKKASTLLPGGGLLGAAALNGVIYMVTGGYDNDGNIQAYDPANDP